MGNYYEREDTPATPQHCGNPLPHDQHGYWLTQHGRFVCTGNIPAPPVRPDMTNEEKKAMVKEVMSEGERLLKQYHPTLYRELMEEEDGRTSNSTQGTDSSGEGRGGAIRTEADS